MEIDQLHTSHADTPGEDILAVLYDALEFIDMALKAGGSVLVHCSQGVSRSATLVIAYLMWRTGLSYDEVFAKVKESRGVANPNIGEENAVLVSFCPASLSLPSFSLSPRVHLSAASVAEAAPAPSPGKSQDVPNRPSPL